MTTPTSHQDNCLMCAVRALTTGDPEIIWATDVAGQSVSGVVLRVGTVDTRYADDVPFLDLWMGGTVRTRVVAHSATLRAALEGAAPEVGDTLTVWFEGWSEPVHGPRRDRPVRVYRATVQRGH